MWISTDKAANNEVNINFLFSKAEVIGNSNSVNNLKRSCCEDEVLIVMLFFYFMIDLYLLFFSNVMLKASEFFQWVAAPESIKEELLKQAEKSFLNEYDKTFAQIWDAIVATYLFMLAWFVSASHIYIAFRADIIFSKLFATFLYCMLFVYLSILWVYTFSNFIALFWFIFSFKLVKMTVKTWSVLFRKQSKLECIDFIPDRVHLFDCFK